MDRRSTTNSRRPRVISIPVHFIQSQQTQTGSALKIQKSFRGFLVRKSVKKIKAIFKEVVEIERRIEAVKGVGWIDEKERLRLNETLMSLLLKLDSVTGICTGVRDCRKRVIKKAIALQERVDSISAITERVAVEEEPKTTALVDSAATSQSVPDQAQIGFEGERKMTTTPEIEDVVVDEEEKKTILIKEEEEVDSISTATSSENLLDTGLAQVTMEEEEEEPKTIHCLTEDDENMCKKSEEKADVTEKDEGNEEMEREKEKKRSREYLLERMVEENEKLVTMMKELNEKNEMQMRLLNSLAQRVEMLEKTVVCDKIARMKKKKRHGGNGPNNNNF